jgi:hypothetical protein
MDARDLGMLSLIVTTRMEKTSVLNIVELQTSPTWEPPYLDLLLCKMTNAITI